MRDEPLFSQGGSVTASFSCVGASGTEPSSQAALKASTHAISLEDEGARGFGRVTDLQKFIAPNVHLLLKDHRIPSSGTIIDKSQKMLTMSHTHVPGRRWETAFGVDLLGERPGFPEA
jgi:hypothetical protein